MPAPSSGCRFRTSHSTAPPPRRRSSQPEPPTLSPSAAIVAEGVSDQVAFEGVDKALEEPDTQVRLFGKPELKGHRRLGVCLARAENVDAAVKKVFRMREKISIKL